MTIAYLAGHTGKRADELRHKLDHLADESQRKINKERAPAEADAANDLSS